MKTWFNYWFGLVILIGLPVLIGLVPDIEFKGRSLGVGVIRQYAVNYMSFTMPVDSANQLVGLFDSANFTTEYALYLFAIFPCVMAAAWVWFFTTLIKMRILNWYTNTKRESQERSIKK